jgi:hypothetical protein
MTLFRVVYAIDVEADSPRKAALKVERLLRSHDAERFRPIFEVSAWREGNLPQPPMDGSEPVLVDLSD